MTSTIDTNNNCHKRVARLARKETFIGRHDQSPELTRYLEKLTQDLEHFDNDIGARFERLMDEMKTAFARHAVTLNEARMVLADVFERLASTPRKASANKQAAFEIDQQLKKLSRHMRPRMLRALENLSPKYKTVEKPLQELDSFLQQITGPLPHHLWLLRTRDKKRAIVPGASIYELEIVPQIDRLCRHRILTPLKLTLLGWHCRYRYIYYRAPFKATLQYCLADRSEVTHAELIQRHARTHDELKTMLANAWRGIRYNLETAAAELDDISASLSSGRTDDVGERPPELQTITFNAIEHSLLTFDKITSAYAGFFAEIMVEMSRDNKNSLSAATAIISDPSITRALFRSMAGVIKYTWSRRIILSKDSVAQYIETIKKVPERLGERSVLLSTFLVYFKRQQPAEESLLQLADLPTEAELLEQCKALPPIYRRLFQNEALTNREFMVGMAQELSSLMESYRRWQLGRASSVAIVGPEGSGKTSLLNCFEYELDEDVKISRAEIQYRSRTSDDVLRILEDALDIEEPSTNAGELIEKIQKLERQIVILENGHNLFLRTIGSRESLETFFYIVMNTRSNLFWLMSFRHHPWTRMGYIHNIDRFFTHVIRSEFHDGEELKSAILLRQTATGQSLFFSPVGINSYRIRRLLLKHNEQDPLVQRALEDLYFTDLFDLSGGNMEAALYYWLRSLEINSEDRISVNPCIKIDTGFIKRLDTMNILSLAEVLTNGGLTIREYGEIFNVDQLRSRLILDYLRQIRILKGHNKDKHGQPQLYTINPLFYQPVYTVLNAMHILY